MKKRWESLVISFSTFLSLRARKEKRRKLKRDVVIMEKQISKLQGMNLKLLKTLREGHTEKSEREREIY